jgi:hypothetical protein
VKEVRTDFFIVGAPKAGTTALYSALAKHPKIFLPELKEPNYFSSADLLKDPLYYRETIITTAEAYGRLYHQAGNRLRGDASVSYLYYPETARRIFEHNPQARIIIMLRHPVERAISHYLMDKRLGYVKHPLEEIFEKGPSGYRVFFQQYFLLGLYTNQIERYLKTFGDNQVKIIFFEQLKDHFSLVVKGILGFLGIVDDRWQPILSNRNPSFELTHPLLSRLYGQRWLRKTLKKMLPERLNSYLMKQFTHPARSILQDVFRQKLLAFYRNDILQLSQLLKTDLSHWLR